MKKRQSDAFKIKLIQSLLAKAYCDDLYVVTVGYL